MHDVNPYRIAEALGKDSRIGSKYLRPGLGFAGPCFPRDNRALIFFSKELNISADLSIATDKINSRQPQKIVDQIFSAFPDVKIVGIIGLTYKPNTKIIEESQTIKVAEILAQKNVQIKLHDPLLTNSELPTILNSCISSLEDLRECDFVLIAKEFESQVVASGINFKRKLIL
jgi:UDPglucose 6-dehydrogenase